jgi:hypothetical protein
MDDKEIAAAAEALRPTNTNWLRRELPPALVAYEKASIVLGAYEQPHRDPLRGMVTIDICDPPEGVWLHLSVSRARRLPTWGDLVTARDALGYGDLYFLQQLPPKRYWLNVHPYVLHLLHRIDQHAVPPILWKEQEGATGRAYGKHG